MRKKLLQGFEVSISAAANGRVEAVYVTVMKGRVSRTKEIEPDVLLADYDSRGRLLGIEILAPVRLSDLTRLVERSRKAPLSRLLKEAAPEQLVQV